MVEEMPIPADMVLLNGHAPQPKLATENGEVYWLVLVYGWRNGTFGNHVYKWNRGRYKTPQWIELKYHTEGRGSLVMEYNNFYVVSTEPTGASMGGRASHRIIKERLDGITPEDIGGH